MVEKEGQMVSGEKELEVKELDFVKFGASGKRNTTAMMREPKSMPK